MYYTKKQANWKTALWQGLNPQPGHVEHHAAKLDFLRLFKKKAIIKFAPFALQIKEKITPEPRSHNAKEFTCPNKTDALDHLTVVSFLITEIIVVRETDMDTTPTLRKRPFGIYAIIVLLLLNISILFLPGVARFMERIGVILPGTGSLVLDPQAMIPTLIIAIVNLITVGGLLLLKRWAWVATMVLAGISMAVGLMLYFEGRPLYVTMLLNVILVFYLNQRDVQATFEHRRSQGKLRE
jgi:hypothetical protein